VSLHRHIRSTYNFDPFERGFVEILAAQQTLERSDWYQGTADAVRQNLRYLQQPDIAQVLILSGDQLYRMNYRELIELHRRTKADVTISAVAVHGKDASGLGIMRVDDSGRVIGFVEKPQTKEQLDLVRTDPAWIDAQGIQSRGRDCLASTGIYLFNRDLLLDLLQKNNDRDFGNEVFPAAIRSCRVQVHLFDGYWEDIGTIRAFYEANLALAKADPPFALASADAPIFTRARFLPPSRFDGATVRESLIADGCVIGSGAVIENSIVGLRCRIGENVQVRNSILLGNDYFPRPEDDAADRAAGRPPLGIGAGTLIEGAIIDKNCHIGSNVRVANASGVDSGPESDQAMVVDGIPVVPKESVLPNGWAM
jgi:glucose-1-phosphate adenylyltransferase